jgi:hypothetical protein
MNEIYKRLSRPQKLGVSLGNAVLFTLGLFTFALTGNFLNSYFEKKLKNGKVQD